MFVVLKWFGCLRISAEQCSLFRKDHSHLLVAVWITCTSPTRYNKCLTMYANKIAIKGCYSLSIDFWEKYQFSFYCDLSLFEAPHTCPASRTVVAVIANYSFVLTNMIWHSSQLFCQVLPILTHTDSAELNVKAIMRSWGIQKHS